MARYDEPGYKAQLPGIPDFDPRAGAAHGSSSEGGVAAEGPPAGAQIATVKVSPTGSPDGAGLGRVPTTVYAGDTNSMYADGIVPAAGDPLTGLSPDDLTQTGSGRGDPTSHLHRFEWQQPNGG